MFTHPRKKSFDELNDLKNFLATSHELKHMRAIAKKRDMTTELRIIENGILEVRKINYAKTLLSKIDQATSFARLIDITRKYSTDPKETLCNSIGRRASLFFGSYFYNDEAFRYYAQAFRRNIFAYMDARGIFIDMSKIKLKKADIGTDILKL